MFKVFHSCIPEHKNILPGDVLEELFDLRASRQMFVVCRVVRPANITHINLRYIGLELLGDVGKADNPTVI